MTGRYKIDILNRQTIDIDDRQMIGKYKIDDILQVIDDSQLAS